MSLTTWLGRGPALLDDARAAGRRLRLPTPVLTTEDLDARDRLAAAVGAAGRHLADVARLSPGWRRRSSGSSPRRSRRPSAGRRDPRHRRPPRRARARAPIPSLLAVAAVHHELVRGRAAHALLAGGRLGRAARGPPRRLPGRLRRRRRAPLAGGRRDRARAGQGPAEGDVQDGRLDRLRLPRRAGVRGDRARAGADRAPLHRHAVQARRARAARARARGADAPRAHLPAGRRALPLAPRRRAPQLEPGHGRRRCSAASGGATSRRRRRRAPRRAARAARVPRARRRSRSRTSSRRRRS